MRNTHHLGSCLQLSREKANDGLNWHSNGDWKRQNGDLEGLSYLFDVSESGEVGKRNKGGS